jgi:hypothetical protein
LGLAIAVAGLIVLLAITNLTDAASSAIMAQAGGSMSTDIFMAKVANAGAAYRVLGGVLLGVGLLRMTQPEER